MGIAERKEREKNLRRQMILSAAESVFSKKGLKAATLDEVAETAELSKGTIYIYFKSKEDLFFSLLTNGLHLLYETLDNPGLEELGAQEAIVKMGELYYRFSEQQPHYFMLFNLTERVDSSAEISSAVFAELQKVNEKIFDLVARYIKRGVDEGVFRSDIDPKEAAILLWITSTGVINLKERAACMHERECGVKNSFMMSIDFDGFYKRASDYMLDMITNGKRGQSDAIRKRNGKGGNSRKAKIKK